MGAAAVKGFRRDSQPNQQALARDGFLESVKWKRNVGGFRVSAASRKEHPQLEPSSYLCLEAGIGVRAMSDPALPILPGLRQHKGAHLRKQMSEGQLPAHGSPDILQAGARRRP